MPVTPIEFIDFAKSLLGGAEIAHRAAASRAYYGAFHTCKALSDCLPAPPPRGNGRPEGGMHDRAIRAMMEFPVSPTNKSIAMAIRRLGIQLNQCRTIRTTADYELAAPFLPVNAQEAIDFSESCLATFQTIKYP